MLLLAIDTATSAVTVALHDGSRVVASASALEPRAHGEVLAVALRRVLAAADATPAEVTAVVAGTGPGPFTGLRVGLVTARVFAWARGIPAYGVCSLDALAYQAGALLPPGDPRTLLVATDARRREVYWASYAPGDRLERLAGPEVCRPADLPDGLRGLPCAGRGPGLYPDHIAPPWVGPLDVDAGALAELAVRRLADGETLGDPTPLYLRRPDARPTAAKPATPRGAA